MAQSIEVISEFIKDYLTRYKDEASLEEVQEDYLQSFDENEKPSLEPFFATWNKLKEEKDIVLVRTNLGEKKSYEWLKGNKSKNYA
mgnify:CR=1 FL=1|jgi:hypothetical protein